MEGFAGMFSVLGAVAGIAALLWRIWDEIRSLLRISLKVGIPDGGWNTALTTVENTSVRRKKITNAVLLIGPSDERPTQTINSLFGADTVKYTNDIVGLKLSEPTINGDRALFPLPFYYSENVDIADETLTSRVAFRLDNFNAGTPYSVRFFIFFEGRLHRSTHDLFIVPRSGDRGEVGVE